LFISTILSINSPCSLILPYLSLFLHFLLFIFFFFFFNDTATSEIYTLSYTTLFRSISVIGTSTHIIGYLLSFLYPGLPTPTNFTNLISSSILYHFGRYSTISPPIIK